MKDLVVCPTDNVRVFELRGHGFGKPSPSSPLQGMLVANGMTGTYFESCGPNRRFSLAELREIANELERLAATPKTV